MAPGLQIETFLIRVSGTAAGLHVFPTQRKTEKEQYWLEPDHAGLT